MMSWRSELRRRDRVGSRARCTVVPGLIVPRANPTPTAFECVSSDAGVDIAWLHAARELDIATTRQREPTLIAFGYTSSPGFYTF
jgi:hypothetical protein